MTGTKPILQAERGGTEITRFNALRHGVLSRYTVLPSAPPLVTLKESLPT